MKTPTAKPELMKSYRMRNGDIAIVDSVRASIWGFRGVDSSGDELSWTPEGRGGVHYEENDHPTDLLNEVASIFPGDAPQ